MPYGNLTLKFKFKCSNDNSVPIGPQKETKKQNILNTETNVQIPEIGDFETFCPHEMYGDRKEWSVISKLPSSGCVLKKSERKYKVSSSQS